MSTYTVQSHNSLWIDASAHGNPGKITQKAFSADDAKFSLKTMVRAAIEAEAALDTASGHAIYNTACLVANNLPAPGKSDWTAAFSWRHYLFSVTVHAIK